MDEIQYKWLLYQVIQHLKDTSLIVFDKDFIESNSKDYLDGVKFAHWAVMDIIISELKANDISLEDFDVNNEEHHKLLA